MENNKNKKSVKFQGDMLNYCDFIQVFVFTSYHHLNVSLKFQTLIYEMPLFLLKRCEKLLHQKISMVHVFG